MPPRPADPTGCPWAALITVVLAGCAGGAGTGATMDPLPRRPPLAIPGDSAGGPPRRVAPPALAHERGWLPRAPTAIPEFLASKPSADGRGVLIAILDSGLDPAQGGFDSTTAGERKLLDLRDFSGEGRIALTRIRPDGDSFEVGGVELSGFSRIRALDVNGPWYGGVLRETALGTAPAADVNGNGRVGDLLPMVLVRATDHWVLFADTDGDGSLGDERGVRDYLVGRATLGWRTGEALSPLAVAVNLADSAGVPVVDLFFDTSGHGTHVAGIAAGRNLYGVPGFNGVAPGAHLLALKIANNAYGGISVTGSILRALEHAIGYGKARGLPLVINLSFGVGNEREAAARLDAMVDSVLDANPDVLFITSAGNDGPGLSTMGFPGSASRALTVGATQPGVFLPPLPAGRTRHDVIAFFSARGGELAKPDLVAPGIAYSSVPRWNVGSEDKSGTSMAAPHVAGLAALLISAAREAGLRIGPADVREALRVSARPLPGGTILDQGAGQPDLIDAWEHLRALRVLPRLRVALADGSGRTAGWRVLGGPRPDTAVAFRLTREGGGGPLELYFRSDAPWLLPPPTHIMLGDTATVTVTLRPSMAREPGVHTGVVAVTAARHESPIARLVTTAVRPLPSGDRVITDSRLAAGALKRFVFAVDSGRPFTLSLAAGGPGEQFLAFLHRPGGQPLPGEHAQPAGADTLAARFEVNGRDAVPGLWEAVAVAQPVEGATARLTVAHAPFRMIAVRVGSDSVLVSLAALGDSTLAGSLLLGAVGGERGAVVSGRGGEEARLPFRLPAWAARAVVELDLDPDQWPRFTDFGLSVLHGDGRLAGTQPMNYANGRVELELPERSADEDAVVVFSPGFAEPESRERWTGTVSIRLYLAAPVFARTESADGADFTLRGRVPFTRVFRLAGDLPRLGDGFFPLAELVAEVGDTYWATTVRLGPPAPPLMR